MTCRIRGSILEITDAKQPLNSDLRRRVICETGSIVYAVMRHWKEEVTIGLSNAVKPEDWS